MEQNKKIYWKNWDYLIEGTNVDEFLSGKNKSLWGEGQDATNLGRQCWYDFVKHLPENSFILEVGTSQCLDIKYLHDNGLLNKHVYQGVDITRKFVEYGQKLNFDIRYYDGVHIDGVFGNTQWDTIYMRHVLEHNPHYTELLNECFKLARYSIFINFFLPPEDTPEDIINFDGYFYHNRYSRKLFEKFITDAGWGIKEEIEFKTSNSIDHIIVLEKL